MMRSGYGIVIAALAACLSLLPRPASAQLLNATRIASGLNLPLFVTSAPGDPYRIYIVEKPGVIKILDLRNPGAGTISFLNITAVVIDPLSVSDERGLLGLAFHPQYATNGLFYVNYINNSGNTVVARYSRLTADSGDPASALQVLTIAQPDTNHNGGWMAFGPDGYLYIASGDGGGAGDDDSGHNPLIGNGQDTATLLGKMLRLDVNGDDFPADPARNYAIPAANPFAGATPGLDEIWAYGLRNPWRNSFDRQTGDLYIADVGQGQWEEINFQPAGSAGGLNYGWRCYEGNAPFNSTNCPGPGPMTFPFLVYGHTTSVPPTNSTGHCSISGGYVYRGCAIPSLQGDYFFADYCSARIWSARYNAGSWSNYAERTSDLNPPSAGVLASIVSFGEDAFGELYIIRHSTASGEVFKIVPQAGIVDCNANNIADCSEIALGLAPDCDNNGVIDSCQIAGGAPDCNGNGRPDSCDIALGFSQDVNNNGIPDECGPCFGDSNGNRVINFADITAVLANFGANYLPGTGTGDANGDGIVNFADITAVLANFGVPCA